MPRVNKYTFHESGLKKMLKWLKTRLILNLKLNLTLGRMMEVGGCQPRPIFTQLKKEV